jgi:hypothetical protein
MRIFWKEGPVLNMLLQHVLPTSAILIASSNIIIFSTSSPSFSLSPKSMFAAAAAVQTVIIKSRDCFESSDR